MLRCLQQEKSRAFIVSTFDLGGFSQSPELNCNINRRCWQIKIVVPHCLIKEAGFELLIFIKIWRFKD
jgi:hypothetical protein